MSSEENSSPTLENGEGLIFNQFDLGDDDNCSPGEVINEFQKRYIETHSLNCSNGVSCSSLLATNSNKEVGIIMANRALCIIDTNKFKKKVSLKPHEKLITDLKFSPTNPNSVITSSIDGFIKIWDMRSGKLEKETNANTIDKPKPLTSFGISSNERILCGGTELIGEDAFLLFWDLRGSKLLGGYWESHSDDITCIKFHSEKPNLMGSSGTDNLLNIFDISKNSEEDALTYILNTEDIVNYFDWVNDHKKKKILAATDVHSLQFWDIEEGAPKYKFSRENITQSLKRSVSYECYNVPLYSTSVHNDPIILAGSGLEHGSGPSSLRTLKLNTKDGSLKAEGLFVNSDEADLNTIILGGVHLVEEDAFITSKDNGIISLWKSIAQCQKRSKKAVSKFKKKYNVNPY